MSAFSYSFLAVSGQLPSSRFQAFWLSLKLELAQILIALPQAVERIPGSLILLDEEMLHAVFLRCLQHRAEVDDAVARLFERGSWNLLVVTLLDPLAEV